MSRIIDLTLPIHEGMPTFPAYWHPPVEITILGRHSLEARASRKCIIGTHTGTHIDAPLHFVPDGKGIDEADLNVLVGPALVINVTYKGPKEFITKEDLERAAAKIDSFERVIIHTGWLKNNYKTTKYFSNRPVLSEEAAQWLYEKGIKLVGFDMADFDIPERSGVGEVAPLHYFFMSHGITIIEGLANVEELPEEVQLVALPLKIQGSDGAPARVIAIVE